MMARFQKDLSISVHDEESVLTYDAGYETSAMMHKWIGAGLKGKLGPYRYQSRKTILNNWPGAYRKIEEAATHAPHGLDRVIFESGEGRSEEHFLFKVDLKDGNSYALDLLGPQYGHYVTVTSWEEYCKIVCLEAMSYTPLGSLAQVGRWMEEKLQWTPHIWNRGDINVLVHSNLVRCLKAASDAWLAKHEIGAAGMLTHNASLNQQEVEAFVAFVEHHVVLFTDWMKDFGEINAINSHQKVFEGYAKDRMTELEELSKGTDSQSVAR